MPPGGRPVKRPGEPAEFPPGAKMKLPRLEEDFSSVVKHKLQGFSRTGQACDRCKVRKIRCDALPQGCSHCTNQNLECFVTDRVTGRTERRGYMIELEQEKTDMMNHIRALEKVLENNGVEVRPYQWAPFATNYPPGVTFDQMGNPVMPPNDPMAKGQWSQVGSAWVRTRQTRPAPPISQPTSFANSSSLEPRRGGGTHLGVGFDSAPVSAINGTKLSILGTTIDISSFAAPEMDELPPNSAPRAPIYNKSIQAFLQSAMNINPPIEGVELPPRNDAFEYSEWYFLMVYPFMPVLHKPSHLALLTRLYDDGTFKPTVSELVVVHMVFATIYFQYGVRNHDDREKQKRLNELSNQHYHWCLSRMYDVMMDHSLTAVQALVLLGNHMRSFPKPGCACMLVNYAYTKAIELHLHRSPRADGAPVTLESEMRSRAWWCLLLLLVTLNGRLGRPMPTILEEFDVPFPLAIPDECLTADGIKEGTRIGSAPYLVGLVAHKIIPLYMEMYTNLYSVRRDPSRHEEVVRRLEDQLRIWQDDLPAELKIENNRGTNTQMFALYAQSFALEFRLCLRHPSVCTSTDPKYQAENTRICEETARKLLKHILVLLKLKSLDTTWYQLSVYVAACFCTLVSNWERRFHITQEEVELLKQDMKLWLSIISEIGLLLGSHVGLCKEVSRVINYTIQWIETDMGRRTPNGTPPAPHQPPILDRDQLLQHHHHQQPQPGAPTTNGSTASDASSANRNGGYYDPTSTGAVPSSSISFQPIAGYGDQGSVVTNGASPGAVAVPAPGPGSAPGSSAAAANEGGYSIYDATATAAAAVAAVAAATSPQAGDTGGPPASQPPSTTATTQNSLMAFASQATQQLAAAASNNPSHNQTGPTPAPAQGGGPPPPPLPQSAEASASVVADERRPGSGGSSTWHDWTIAIIGSQERFVADALRDLGSGGGSGGGVANVPPQSLPSGSPAQQPRDGSGAPSDSAGRTNSSGSLAEIAAAAAQQWPLLLFSEAAASAGSEA